MCKPEMNNNKFERVKFKLYITDQKYLKSLS